MNLVYHDLGFKELIERDLSDQYSNNIIVVSVCYYLRATLSARNISVWIKRQIRELVAATGTKL